MLQEVYGNSGKEIFREGQKVMRALTQSSKSIPCEMTECIHCLDNNCCGLIYPPRNEDGYCKDFVSIND
ncbi:hypothetical protein E306M_09970 [Moorella sp. E306M]|nr:hypothetical protein E306M_09970 [Moorella sp. E306M]